MPVLKEFTAGLFTIYGLGFLGYSFIPAGGPYLAYHESFDVPLLAGPVTAINTWAVIHGSNGVDVFPSLHCAISFFLLFFDRTRAPLRFRIMLLPCFGIVFATIYLRYHYFADLVAGFALAAFALWISHLTHRRHQAAEKLPSPVPLPLSS